MTMALRIGPKARFILPATDTYQFHSGITHRDYEVSVAVMAPVEPGRRYPVLYVMDGDGSLPFFASVVPLMQAGKELPGMIVAGIGYGLSGLISDPAVLQQWAGLRMTDLVPTRQADGDGGGAPEFLRFVTEELMPFINTNYPADADDCGLAGGSLGGLFTLYAMLASPGTFRRFLAGSPAIIRSRDLLLSLEEKLAEGRTDFPVRLFMGVGSLEPEFMQSDMKVMADRLASRGYARFQLTTRVFDGESHFSVWPGAFSRGLRTIFQSE
ncbi:MAG: alpha/beta hydrolase [Dehalococcoidia bacterium]|nr:alpha/beta hydrolase [Chloroflexi bacterium CFX7]NUQ54798.1 alpha/beta hydrolase [Dehalococcoidia bacterium]